MLAIEGIYENGQIRMSEAFPLLKRAKVIVTIIETLEEWYTDQENADMQLFDDMIGIIDFRKDGSVSHDNYIGTV